MGTIITASGTRIFIGPAVTSEQADSVAEFAALAGYQEIGLVESLGGFGDESAEVTFAEIGAGRVRKAKGARNAGTLAIVVAHDPLDVGQQAIENAEETNDNYAFKVILPDAPTGEYNDSVYYFRGLVMSQRLEVGTNDNVVKKTYNVGLNSELFAVAADRQTLA